MRTTQVKSVVFHCRFGSVLFFDMVFVPNWVARTPAGHDMSGWGLN
jgi:hypothetical protein